MPVFIYAKLLQKLLELKLIRVCDGVFLAKEFATNVAFWISYE